MLLEINFLENSNKQVFPSIYIIYLYIPLAFILNLLLFVKKESILFTLRNLELREENYIQMLQI